MALGFLAIGVENRSLDGDEGTYAAVALETQRAEKWLPLRLHGHPFVNKPPAALLLQRVAFTLFPARELSARAPSLVAGALLAAAVFAAGTRLAGAAGAAIATLLLLSTPGLLGGAGWHGLRSGTTDALLILLVAVTNLLSIDLLCAGAGRPTRWLAALGTGAALTKGLAALIYTAPALCARAAFAPRTAAPDARRPTLQPLLVVSASICGTFLIWLMLVDSWLPGESLPRLLDRDIWQRAAVGLNAAHLRGADFYPRQIWRDFGLFLLPAAWALTRIRPVPTSRPSSTVLALLAWATLPVALASLSASKLPWYRYPTYPAWCVLAGAGATDLVRLSGSASRSLRGVAVGLLALGLAHQLFAAANLLTAPHQPLAMAELADWTRAQPHVAVYWDDTLRFGEGGVTSGNYFYLLTIRPPAQPAPDLLPDGTCALVLSTAARSGGADSASVVTPMRRLHPAHPELVLVDRCGGELARRISADPGAAPP